MLRIRRAADRGQANFGWLHSQHSFSFGSYYNPAHMGVSMLRVLNDDWVAPGAGFETHSHRDMEIISLVLEGTMVHRDSAGHQQFLQPGEFQLMSAGRGISHSEFNGSPEAPLRFLQIWIRPAQTGGEPSYQQRAFATQPGLTLVVSPEGTDASLQIKQQAWLWQAHLAAPQSLVLSSLNLAPHGKARSYYLHVIEGEITVTAADGEQAKLLPGDALTIALANLDVATELDVVAANERLPVVTAHHDSRALLFALP